MIKLSIHTQRRMRDRKIPLAWIEAALASPDRTTPDPDPALTRSYKTITAAEDRVLRVVHRPDGDDILVITAHFDRGAKRMMRTSYDPETDVFYARFAPDEAAVAETAEVAPGVMIDFDADGQMVGIEILSVRTRGSGQYGTKSALAAE